MAFNQRLCFGVLLLFSSCASRNGTFAQRQNLYNKIAYEQEQKNNTEFMARRNSVEKQSLSQEQERGLSSVDSYDGKGRLRKKIYRSKIKQGANFKGVGEVLGLEQVPARASETGKGYLVNSQ